MDPENGLQSTANLELFAEIRRQTSTPPAGHVRLCQLRLGDAGALIVAQVLQSPMGAGITSLDLSSNGIGAAGGRALLAAVRLYEDAANLKRLTLWGNPVLRMAEGAAIRQQLILNVLEAACREGADGRAELGGHAMGDEGVRAVRTVLLLLQLLLLSLLLPVLLPVLLSLLLPLLLSLLLLLTRDRNKYRLRILSRRPQQRPTCAVLTYVTTPSRWAPARRRCWPRSRRRPTAASSWRCCSRATRRSASPSAGCVQEST